MDYDYTKDGVENLIDLINEKNSTSFNRTHLAFGTPQHNLDEPPQGADPADTQVTVSGLAGVSFTGSKTIYYNRIELSEVLNTTDFQLDNTLREFNSVHDLLLWFTEQGYLFTQSDLENDLLLALPGANDQVIRAKPESLIFRGVAKISITNPA